MTMAKENGLGWTTLSVDDSGGSVCAIKNDVTDLQFATPRAVQVVTGVDKSAIERLLGLADFTITLTVVFNDAASACHQVFKTVPSTSVARTTTLAVSGNTLANEVLYTDYPLARDASGALTAKVPGVLSDGTVPTWA
jgi:hypothetical protein